MGATDRIYTFKIADKKQVAENRKTIQEHWDRAVRLDVEQNGNDGYTGGPSTMRGMVDFCDETFTDRANAEEFILNRHQKWLAPLAVLVEEKGQTYYLVGGWAAE